MELARSARALCKHRSVAMGTPTPQRGDGHSALTGPGPGGELPHWSRNGYEQQGFCLAPRSEVVLAYVCAVKPWPAALNTAGVNLRE